MAGCQHHDDGSPGFRAHKADRERGGRQGAKRRVPELILA